MSITLYRGLLKPSSFSRTTTRETTASRRSLITAAASKQKLSACRPFTSRPSEYHIELHLPDLTFAPKSIAATFRSARRPASKCAVFIAALFFACCITQSDAQVENMIHMPFAASRIVGTSSTAQATNDAQRATDAAKNGGAVASAQSMLTTPKYDDFSMMPERVTPLRVDTQIHARRVFVDAMPTFRFTPHLAPGQHRTLRAGTSGVAWVTERITYWNDVPVGRQAISHELVRSAKPAIVLVGTPRTLAQLRAALPKQALAAALTMEATAYTADTATAYPTGYTATGILAREGVVAVDPHVIPLGTTLFVPGYGIAIAADTGGAIVGNRIDLCMDRYGDAVNFGRRTVQVYILKR
jgi:3D (Asp-Asp-Asp) domain-containing protein